MSKDLKRDAERLQGEADRKVEEIRRTVRAYGYSNGDGTLSGATRRIDMQRELERVVDEYIRLHKSIKRLRKKMQV